MGRATLSSAAAGLGAPPPCMLHDPLVRVLTRLFDSVFGPARVLAERDGTRRQLTQWMGVHGVGVQHRPDIVISGLHGPGSFTLIDVKTLDVCGPMHIQSHQSHRVRLAPHAAVERPLPLIMGRLGLDYAWSRLSFPPLAPSARRLAPSSLASCGCRARCRLPSTSTRRGRRRVSCQSFAWPPAFRCVGRPPPTTVCTGGGGWLRHEWWDGGSW